MSTIYQLKTEQDLPISLTEAWSFLSSPRNLKRITPDYMGFDITTKHLADRMYPGMVVSYIVKPVLGIPTPWVTEITHVVENEYFVDEQRHGPYAIWHHEHRIKEIDGGVRMTDLLSYKPPFGVLGRIANNLFISKKVKEIFEYREKALIDIFGEFPSK